MLKEQDAAAAGQQGVAQEDSLQHRAVYDHEPLAAMHLLIES